jgi:hypothetical protein
MVTVLSGSVVKLGKDREQGVAGNAWQVMADSKSWRSDQTIKIDCWIGQSCCSSSH